MCQNVALQEGWGEGGEKEQNKSQGEWITWNLQSAHRQHTYTLL